MTNGCQALRDYRAQRGLTQDDLAKTLAVSSITVSRWETGARKIDPARLPAVSELLGVPKRALRPDLAELLGDAPR